MILHADDIEQQIDDLGFPIRELTKTQRETVNKLFEREKWENRKDEKSARKYKSVIQGNYKFEIGDDPFGLNNNPDTIESAKDDLKWYERWHIFFEDWKVKKAEADKKAKEEKERLRLLKAQQLEHKQQSQSHSQQQQQQRE